MHFVFHLFTFPTDYESETDFKTDDPDADAPPAGPGETSPGGSTNVATAEHQGRQ